MASLTLLIHEKCIWREIHIDLVPPVQLSLLEILFHHINNDFSICAAHQDSHDGPEKGNNLDFSPYDIGWFQIMERSLGVDYLDLFRTDGEGYPVRDE